MKETAVAGLKIVPQNWTGRTGENQGKHKKTLLHDRDSKLALSKRKSEDVIL